MEGEWQLLRQNGMQDSENRLNGEGRESLEKKYEGITVEGAEYEVVLSASIASGTDRENGGASLLELASGANTAVT